jgi:hypothetical protein
VSPVQVKIGPLAAHALAAAEDPDPDRLELLLPRAIRFYFEEREGERDGWGYPPFLDGTRIDGDGHEVSLADDLWQQVQAEAGRQEVTPEDLLQHAAFYYGAARDDGRLTARIAAELQREEEGGVSP